MDNSDDIIYKPVKYQSATVGLVSYSKQNKLTGEYIHNIYTNLFNAEAHNTKVELKKISSSKYDNRISYKQFEELSTTGGYIITDITPTSSDKFEITFKINKLPTEWAGICGCKTGYDIDASSYGIFLNPSGTLRLDYTGDNITVDIEVGKTYTIVMQGNTVWINDTKYIGSKGKTDATRTFYIGNLNQGSSGWQTSDITIFDFKYNDNSFSFVQVDGESAIYNVDNEWLWSDDICTLSKEIIAEVEWTGYATPNTYNQDFNNLEDELQLECIDGLSTLQYYKYTEVMYNNGKINSSIRRVVSFIDIINKLLYLCDCYKNFYMSTANVRTLSQSELLASVLYISECNFFDDDEEKTDKENAWTCQDVLEELCKFLGVTAIAEKDSVYFVDYDAIKNKKNSYMQLPVLKPNNNGYYTGSGNMVNLNDSKEIVAEDFKDAATTITSDNTYNKITVKDNLNTFDYVLPDLFDDGGINITGDESSITYDATGNDGYKQYTSETEIALAGEDKVEFIKHYYVRYHKSGNKAPLSCGVWMQFWDAPKWKLNTYTVSNKTLVYNQDITDFGTIVYSDLQKNIGAFPIKYMVNALGADNSDEQNDKNTTKINYSKAIALTWHNTDLGSETSLNMDSNNYLADTYRNYPFLESPDSYTNEYFLGGQNTYLLFTGQVIVQDRKDLMFPLGQSTDESRNDISSVGCYIDCQAKCGDYYYNDQKDSSGNIIGWQTTPCYFKLPFMTSDSLKTAQEVFGNELSITNNVGWRTGINEDGYSIKLPDNVKSGNISVKICNPYKIYNEKYFKPPYEPIYRTDVIFLKDFKVKAVTVSQNNDIDSDTEYSLITNSDYVQELDDIEFKVCTYDNKKPNYSCVTYKDGNGEFKYLDRYYHTALSYDTEVLDAELYDRDQIPNGSLRSESWLVYKCWKQYRESHLKIELTAKNDIQLYSLVTVRLFPDKEFIVDNINRDYRFDTATYTLIEKQ